MNGRFWPISAVWQSERLRSGLGEKATTSGTAHLFRSARAVQFEMVEPTGFWERPDRAAKSLNFRALYFYRESQFSVVSGPGFEPVD